MNTSVLRRRTHVERVPLPNRAKTSTDTVVSDDVVAELSSTLFSAFRRKDQRQKAEQYLRGLLFTEGRKSIRNIAAHVGGPTAEQSLHHFISSSTWDWQPMRAALGSYLEQESTPQAWVVRSMHIPKAGGHSVGVDRLFEPQLGQTFHGQQAFGVWFASEGLSIPVNWRLLLSDQWVNDHERRERAEVPQGTDCESSGECAVSTVLDTALNWDVACRPVLLDLRDRAVRPALAQLAKSGLPVLGRIGAPCRLSVTDRAMLGFGAGPLPAKQILESTKGLRRPVHWLDASRQHASRTSLVSAVRVSLPGLRTNEQRPMLLMGEWHDPQRSPTAMWLTDLTASPVARLLRMTKLTLRVEHDFTEAGKPAGLRDFVGRSFRGWHRHITLASVAHAAIMLSAGLDLDYGSGPALA